MPAHMSPMQIPNPVVISPLRHAAASAGLYVLLCAAYIFFSGNIAARMSQTSQELHTIETIKGFFFIAITGIVFFAISYMRWRKIRQQEDILLAEEKTLLQSQGKLVAAMSSAIVAHDLKHLLLSLSGLLEKIRNHERSEPALREMGDQVDLNIEKLRHLSKRLESAVGRTIREKKEPIDMLKTLKDLTSVVKTHPDVQSSTITLSEVAPLTLTLNRTLLEEAVLNLLINAAQASNPNGKIDIRLKTQPGMAILSVHDNGPGVPDFLLKDIFEPCFTTKPGGSGIGLLAVTAFTASCGADIQVGRSPLGGASFELLIPIQNEPSPRSA